MPVSAAMRDVEMEIDGNVASMRLWNWGRAAVLEGLLRAYRDGVELVHFRTLRAQVCRSADEARAERVNEVRWRDGAFWALKWATTYCPEVGRDDPINEKALLDTILIGQAYDALVDVLKYGEMDLVELLVNDAEKVIVCYEGHDHTGHDAAIVEHQQAHGPSHSQASLTADGDQLTSNWCAGDYRRVVRVLADLASDQEGRIVMDPDFVTTVDGEEISIPQPTLVWLERPKDLRDAAVFCSLTIPRNISDTFMWKARSLLETPIVSCAGRFFALSSDLRAIASVDDYMLRLAVREDETQYSKASGRREERMIKACLDAFEGSNRGWTVKCHFKLKAPPRKVDVVATGLNEVLVIELKSTLRPEALSEVHNRNQDILRGVHQAATILQRGVGTRGLVITDGYRGDYVCWKEALKHGVTIGTLGELEELAIDPNRAIRLMKTKAGIPTADQSRRRISDRETELFGWTLRLVDPIVA